MISITRYEDVWYLISNERLAMMLKKQNTPNKLELNEFNMFPTLQSHSSIASHVRLAR